MVKRYNHNYVIYKKYKLDDIYKQITKNKLPEQLIYHEKDYKDSLRRMDIIYNLIKRDGNKCLHCGKEPTIFAMGKDVSNRWHMDLYREEDNMLMFTIDHIHPKSKGGEDNLDNFQMLCKICNEDKGDSLDNLPKSKKRKKYKPKYINKKLDSLSQQINGVLTKLKSHNIVNINALKNFTIGNVYKIENITVNINSEFKSIYEIQLINDNNKLISTSFDFFITTNDFYLLNK